MLMVISPAKTLDFESPLKVKKFTQPDFLSDSRALMKKLREFSPEDISELMHVSANIGELNFGRNINWKTPFTQDNARQAAYAFKGDVYLGLQFEQFKGADLSFAQKHLRILSGLYGALRPLDLIQPYRLEMGVKFASSRGKNLYEFWDNKVTKGLNLALAEQKDKVLINLASNEYFKVVKKDILEAEVITPVFKDYKNGQYKVISFFAKRARGMMTAYVIKNRVSSISDLKKFSDDGYRFNKELSERSKNANELVFTRKQL